MNWALVEPIIGITILSLIVLSIVVITIIALIISLRDPPDDIGRPSSGGCYGTPPYYSAPGDGLS